VRAGEDGEVRAAGEEGEVRAAVTRVVQEELAAGERVLSSLGSGPSAAGPSGGEERRSGRRWLRGLSLHRGGSALGALAPLHSGTPAIIWRVLVV